MFPCQGMDDKILNILTNKDNVTWKTMIFELIEHDNMDPWDINVSHLSKGYLKLIRHLKGFDFLIGGKVLLAASFLLRLKSVKLVDENLSDFDKLIAESQVEEDDFISDFYTGLEEDWGDSAYVTPEDNNQLTLTPRTPQPRKRKVSVYDLVEALQKAIEVHERKVLRNMDTPEMEAPTKKKDITEIIRDIYTRIKTYFSKNGQDKLTFSNLVASRNKEDIISTFVPLLHLSHMDQRKIDLLQEEHFGEIEIKLTS